jgi:hypothetical protein
MASGKGCQTAVAWSIYHPGTTTNVAATRLALRNNHLAASPPAVCIGRRLQISKQAQLRGVILDSVVGVLCATKGKDKQIRLLRQCHMG